jgi:hypothetical protein
MSQRIHFGKIHNESNRPFDFSPRVTYNLGYAKYCHTKTHPLTADLVPDATTVKENLWIKKNKDSP